MFKSVCILSNDTFSSRFLILLINREIEKRVWITPIWTAFWTMRQSTNILIILTIFAWVFSIDINNPCN